MFHCNLKNVDNIVKQTLNNLTTCCLFSISNSKIHFFSFQFQVSHYTFSLSWSRILPNITTNFVNMAGILYYNQLIDALIDARIEPVITLNYWDLPQEVINIGGWTNNITINLFNDFAELCFQQFGDRVSQK